MLLLYCLSHMNIDAETNMRNSHDHTEGQRRELSSQQRVQEWILCLESQWYDVQGPGRTLKCIFVIVFVTPMHNMGMILFTCVVSGWRQC